MTVTEIEAEVEETLNRVGVTAVSSRVAGWVGLELKEWAEHAVWPPLKPVNDKEPGRRRVGEPHDWTFLTSTQDFTTTASLATYALEVALLRPKRIWFEITGWDRARYLDLELLRQVYYGRSEGKPEAYSIVFSEDDATAPVLYLFPTPSDAWAGHLTYVRKATTITGAQTNIFTLRWPEGIIAGTVARGLRLLRQYDEANDWEEQKGRHLAEAIASDRRAESEADMTLGISTVADGDPENPRPILSEYPYGRKIDPDSWV